MRPLLQRYWIRAQKKNFLPDIAKHLNFDYRIDLYINIHCFKTENSCSLFFRISENMCKILCYYMRFRILHVSPLFHLHARVQLFLLSLFIFWNSENTCKILYNYVRFRILHTFSLFHQKNIKTMPFSWYQMAFMWHVIKCYQEIVQRYVKF